MAYTTAQRLDPSTDEAMEQAERVRALITSDGMPAPPTPPSTLPYVAEIEEDLDTAFSPLPPQAAPTGATTASASAGSATLSEQTIASAASAAAATAAKAASAAAVSAAATAAAMSSPRPRRAGDGGGGAGRGGVVGRPVHAPVVVVAGGGGGGKEVTNVWGQLGGSERDSDCMSVDTSASVQGLLAADLRWV